MSTLLQITNRLDALRKLLADIEAGRYDSRIIELGSTKEIEIMRFKGYIESGEQLLKDYPELFYHQN